MTQHISAGDLPQPGARAIVLDLVARGDHLTVTTAVLVKAGAAFGIEATGMRTAIARLRADGRLIQIERGIYARGPQAEPIVRRLRGWRDVIDRRITWNGGWLLAVTGAAERTDRTTWRRTLRAFDLEGFDEAEANLWIRPDNRAGGAAATRAALRDLGAAPALFLARVEDLDEDRDVQLRVEWREARQDADYGALARALADHRQRSTGEPLATIAATTLVLGREAIRRIIRDPLRPDGLGGVNALRELVSEMVLYDVVGQAAWQAYLNSPAIP